MDRYLDAYMHTYIHEYIHTYIHTGQLENLLFFKSVIKKYRQMKTVDFARFTSKN